MKKVLKKIKKVNNLNLDNGTIYSLADRLMYLVVKAKSLSDKELRKLKLLVSEIEKKDIIELED